MADSAPAPTIVNNNTTSQTKTKTSVAGGGYDDRSAYSKKASQ